MKREKGKLIAGDGGESRTLLSFQAQLITKGPGKSLFCLALTTHMREWMASTMV